MKMLFRILTFVTVIIVVKGSKMEMPSFATVGDRVVIECKLDYEQDVIEHIKWYKNNQLFYTFVPTSQPPAASFDLPGVEFDFKESKQDKVIMNSVSEASSGLYTCELKLEHGMARMSGTLTIYPSKE